MKVQEQELLPSLGIEGKSTWTYPHTISRKNDDNRKIPNNMYSKIPGLAPGITGKFEKKGREKKNVVVFFLNKAMVLSGAA